MPLSEFADVSSLILIGAWSKSAQDNLGAEIISDTDIIPWDRLEKTEVLGVTVNHLINKDFQHRWQQLQTKQPWTQLVALIPKGYSAKALTELIDLYNFLAIFKETQNEKLENILIQALEKSRVWAQDFKFESLMIEQNERMQSLHQDLEDRIEKRTRSLSDARRRLFSTNSRAESLRKALTAINSAASTEEIELNLNDALASGIGTTWIRICSAPEDEAFARETVDLPFVKFQAPLFRNDSRIGSLFFMRETSRPFLRDEKQLLTKVSEAASLALERLNKLNETENIRRQWTTTFSAIQDPLVIIDENYLVLQSNKESLTTGRPCYEVLFDRSEPCPQCQRGSSFTTTDSNRTLEVHSQELDAESQEAKNYLNVYHDISEKVRIEKQIIEKSKLAELGTIGSSIAHELNNPIGGILNFAQLIKMDMKKDHPLYVDIEAIEHGALRCKEIVENLLVFVRNPHLDRSSEIDLRELTQRALKISSLEARSKKIEIKFENPTEPILVEGQINVLVQGLVLLMQLCMEGLVYEPKAFLKIHLSNNHEQNAEIIIQRHPNVAIKNSDFRQSAIAMLSRILQDNRGRVEFENVQDQSFMAKISLPRPAQRS